MTYTAATDIGFHARSFFGDVYALEMNAAPVSAIWYKLSAHRTSSHVNRRTLIIRPTKVDDDGSRENKGSNSGA